MSVTESIVSSSTSAISSEYDTETRLQKCVYVRNFLGLDAFLNSRSDRLGDDRYIQISSKTLRENYVLPDDGIAVEGVFTRLIELIKECKKMCKNLPKTDFTCLSRTDRKKLWIDVDCLSCKRGDQVKDKRHLKITKLVELIATTIENVFDVTVEDGVYLTNGKNTCGFHVFFNTLAYDSANVTTSESTLMDALVSTFRRAKMTNVGVDRGCTQMPMPTATHSNSNSHTRPYRMVKECEEKWTKLRIDWAEMDVETLKCFSSIAFSKKYNVNVIEPLQFLIPHTRVPVAAKRKIERSPVADDARFEKKMRHADDDVEEDESLNEEVFTEFEDINQSGSPDETVGGLSTEMPPPPLSNFPARTKPDVEDDEVSLLSKYTESSLLSSFHCPSVFNAQGPQSTRFPSFRVDQQKGVAKIGENVSFTTPSLNVIDRLSYACEDDKASPFPDKQYKAALLCAEEEEANASKVRLAIESRNVERSIGNGQRVYVTDGSSSNAPREYKLLVQLANVNRAVYRGDIWPENEWKDMLVSYYDQHLRNPVLLEMFSFVFQDKEVVPFFTSLEKESVVTTIVRLMTPFKLVQQDDDTPDADRLFFETEFEQEARPYKVRLVGALIRVCTQLFGLTTAVFSDFWKIQKANERRDMSLLNRTIVNSRVKVGFRPVPKFKDDLDCSASMCDGDDGGKGENIDTVVANHYTMLASLIVHEQRNLSDMSLYALLYYYHSFPFGAIDRTMDEIHHEGLMVTAVIRYFLMYDHRNGKTLTLQEIFEGFNDCAIALRGPVGFLKLRRKNQKRGDANKGGGGARKSTATSAKNNDPEWKRRRRKIGGSESNIAETAGVMEDGSGENGGGGDVTPEEVNRLLGGAGRRRKMCSRAEASRIVYDYKDKHMWEAVINYYLRPVAIHDDKMVFANDNYDTLEEDAVESSVAHLATSSKNTKGDVQTAFKDARTAWRMPHGSQLIYESDLRSDRLGCCFHINVALKMYEMFCGGCVTRMKRVHKNYLIDRSRFNMTIYDVVAECRTATVDLTAAIDRSYVNLLLRQPVVPPFLERKDDGISRLYMTEYEIGRGSFCCLSVMDYIRVLNLFERSNYKNKTELDTCDYVEKFLNDLYTNEIAAELPPNPSANAKVRLLYAFFSLYLFEVVFSMRHVYAKRENLFVPIERLCNELDVRELIVLFFGESSMNRVEGLDDDLDHRLRTLADDLNNVKRSSGENDADGSIAGGRFDVRPVLAAEIPDKVARMKTLFGQFGFDVMQDSSNYVAEDDDAPVMETDAAADRDAGENDSSSSSGSGCSRVWDDETKFEQEFYAADNWLDALYERMLDRKIVGNNHKRRSPLLTSNRGSGARENMFACETLRTIMRLETKRHIDNDRLGKLIAASNTANGGVFDSVMEAAKNLPMRLKLLALILTTHAIKSKTKSLCPEVVESLYREVDGRFSDERRTYDGDVNSTAASNVPDPPEKVWCRRTEVVLSEDPRSLLIHARWLSEQRFKSNFFVGLDTVQVYNVLYEYMKDNADRYPSFRDFERTEGEAARNICTAVMFLLIMSAYDQEHLDLYLKVFLAVEWPGQWAKTIFVWKSNSNAGKSYFFDSIVKRACANSTCINDPKGGKENAPEKAEYVRNFVLFANEFSQANSNELKKIVSESTFKFRMNYGNVMNEAYATGKIMFNCNTLPPTSDEAAINRLTLFDIPFWFCARQKISDAMLNWIRGPSASASRWEIAYRHELPSLLTSEAIETLKSHSDTKNETDLFDDGAVVRRSVHQTEYSRATSSLFLVQNKTSRLYVSSSPPTDRIVYGLVNITTHFSWLRFFKRLDMPVDFTVLPASSEAVRSEWLSLTLPYQEWKQITGARTDTNRVPAESVYRSLQAFASKKNINYFGIKQFFETDFASSREAIKDEYYIWFDSKAFRD